MKRVPRIIYQSADELEERIRKRKLYSMQFSPNTNEYRRIMSELAMLRMHADAKRWLWGDPVQRRA